MLIAVNDRPGLDQRALMRLLAIDRSTIGTTLNVIEKRGLVERMTPKSNGRVKPLFITDAGRTLLEDARSCFEPFSGGSSRPWGKSTRPFTCVTSRALWPPTTVSRAPLAVAIVPHIPRAEGSAKRRMA